MHASNSLSDPRVALIRDRAGYAATPPFDASEAFPEWPGAPVGTEDNPAYRGVRSALAALGLDAANFGTATWNPLGDLISPGETVLLKPNLVSHVNLGARAYGLTDTDSLVTHGSFIRVTFDYVAKALAGTGRIIIGDCPIQDTDWDALVRLVGLDLLAEQLRDRYPGIELVVRDYRKGKAVMRGGVMIARVTDDVGSPNAIEVDLGDRSCLAPITGGTAEFGVSRYPRHRMRRAHQPGTHKYLIGGDFLDADVMITLPKMKSHMKAGITCALKNFVGINAHKDYLPHFRFGSPKNGGDEYPDGNWFWDLMWWFRHHDWDRDGGAAKLAFFGAGAISKLLLPYLGRRSSLDVAMGGGGWHGNETLWRTVLDINRAFFYFDRTERRVTERFAEPRYLALLDGLIGGHRESPLAPTPVASGVVLAARNPVALDAVAAVLMGLSPDRLPMIREGFRLTSLPLTSFGADAVVVQTPEWSGTLDELEQRTTGPYFDASRGFKGHVERIVSPRDSRMPQVSDDLSE